MPWPVLVKAGAGACEGSESGRALGEGKGCGVCCAPTSGLPSLRGFPRLHTLCLWTPPCSAGARGCRGWLCPWWDLLVAPAPIHCPCWVLWPTAVPRSLPSCCFPTLRDSRAQPAGFGQRRGQGTEDPPLSSVSACGHRPCQAGPAASRCLWSCAVDSLLLIESWEGTLWR